MLISDSTRRFYAARAYTSSTNCGDDLKSNIIKMLCERFDAIFKASWTDEKVYPLERFEISTSGGRVYMSYMFRKTVYTFQCSVQQFPAQCGMMLVKDVTFSKNAPVHFMRFCLYFMRELSMRNQFASQFWIIAPNENLKALVSKDEFFTVADELCSDITLAFYNLNFVKNNLTYSAVYDGYK